MSFNAIRENKMFAKISGFTVLMLNIIIWASTRETCLQEFANNKGADQPVHPGNLIRAFVIRLSMLATSKILPF